MTTPYLPNTIVSGNNAFATFTKDGANRNAAPIQDYYKLTIDNTNEDNDYAVFHPPIDLLLTSIILEANNPAELTANLELLMVTYSLKEQREVEKVKFKTGSFHSSIGLYMPLNILVRSSDRLSVQWDIRPRFGVIYAVPASINPSIGNLIL